MPSHVHFPSRPPAFAALAALAPLAMAAALACGVAGCDPSPAAGPASPPPSSLPAYGGDSADQFDDTIEAHAVGLELENYASPKNDLRLRARAQAADAVVRARIQTVTGEAGSGSHSYQISFKTLAHLAGKRPIGDEFTVRIDKTSPSLGIVRSMEGQLVGKTLVIFAKAFARPDGDRDLHFHASADGADVVDAVKEAVILDEVK